MGLPKGRNKASRRCRVATGMMRSHIAPKLRLVRMDGARGFTADLATRKARTSSSLGVSTSVLEILYKDRPLSSQDLIATKGGLPVLHDGQCSGAIGISGALPDIDEQIAVAGVGALG
jgi:glc operon protein GlcG